MSVKKYSCLLLLLITFQKQYAQYTLNGTATRDACNEYTLTPAVNWQGGSVWNNIKINLTQSFDFNFDVLLGSNNIPGADGIAFVLQPVGTSVGSSGGGMGYQGITPAVGVIIDTYQNSINNDPGYDHIAFQLNGDISHNTANNIAGPVTALNGNDNIEDGNWHSLRIVWNTVTKTLTATVDGSLRLTVVKDLITDVFSGDPFVYWGFTGATGGENNLQKFKTALNPAFHFAPNQKRCLNEPITFYDSTISFAPIVKFYWDFGDGSPVDSVNLNPVHIYATAGDYTVKQRVIGADGCEATNTQTIRVGSKPLAAFDNSDNCVLNTIQYSDLSSTAVGTINNWFWDFNNTSTSAQQNPSTTYAAGGDKTVRLVVRSIEGCESDTLNKLIHIFTRPVLDFTFTDSVCLGSPTGFFGVVVSSSDPVVDWLWDFGGSTANTQNASYTFTTANNHTVILAASCNGSAGCRGSVQKDIINYGTKAFAGNDTIIASGRPLQLRGSGGISYEWTPATGLNDPFIANPVAVLTGSQIYIYTLKAYSPQGCESFDDINIQVYQAPEIYLPNAFTPDGNGTNDVYKSIPVGIKEFKFLKIFNRYGQQVFYTTDYQKGWDGRWKGKEQNSGVYVVIATGIDYRGLVVERKTTVIMIR